MQTGEGGAAAAAEAAEASAEAAEAAAGAAVAEAQSPPPPPASITEAAVVTVATAEAAAGLAAATAASAELEAAEKTARVVRELEEWKMQTVLEISSLKDGQAAIAATLPDLTSQLSSIQQILTERAQTVTAEADPETGTVTVQVEEAAEPSAGDPSGASTDENPRHRFL